MKEERSLLKEGYTGCHISIYLDLLDQVYLFRLFLTFPHNLTLSAFESQFLNSMELSNSCKRWSLVHLKRAWEVPIFNKQWIRTCAVPNFHPGLKNRSIISEIWNFHPRLAKPSWNFNSVYRVEFFTCNYNVFLQRSLLFSRDKFLTRYTELECQPGLKISI